MNCSQVPRPLPNGSAYRRPAKTDPRWSPAAVGLAVFLLHQKQRDEFEEPVEGRFERAGNTAIAGLGVLGLAFATCMMGCSSEELVEVGKFAPVGQAAFWLCMAVVAVAVAAAIIVICKEVL